MHRARSWFTQTLHYLHFCCPEPCNMAQTVMRYRRCGREQLDPVILQRTRSLASFPQCRAGPDSNFGRLAPASASHCKQFRRVQNPLTLKWFSMLKPLFFQKCVGDEAVHLTVGEHHAFQDRAITDVASPANSKKDSGTEISSTSNLLFTFACCIGADHAGSSHWTIFERFYLFSPTVRNLCASFVAATPPIYDHDISEYITEEFRNNIDQKTGSGP